MLSSSIPATHQSHSCVAVVVGILWILLYGTGGSVPAGPAVEAFSPPYSSPSSMHAVVRRTSLSLASSKNENSNTKNDAEKDAPTTKTTTNKKKETGTAAPAAAQYGDLANTIQGLLAPPPPPNTNGKMALLRKAAGDYDPAVIRAQLQTLITDEPVLMLSFTTCPFCLKAKNILEGILPDMEGSVASYTVVELDQVQDGAALRVEMAGIIDQTSVPAIWIGGEFIGGCNDGPNEYGGITNLQQTGQLTELVAAAVKSS